MQRFKERLKFRRNALGWSQIILATKSGVSERAIAGFESKGGLPSGSVVERLASALGCSPAWLMGGQDEPDRLRDAGPESEAELWRRRAVRAERELHELKSGLRGLLAGPATEEPPPLEAEGLPIDGRANSKVDAAATRALKHLAAEVQHPAPK